MQEEKLRGRSRRQQEKPQKNGVFLKAAGVAAALAVLAAGGGIGYYFLEMGRYETAFFPNTSINGIDASRKSVEEVKAQIEAGLSGYELTILGREGTLETIKKEEIGLHSEFDGSLEEILVAQNPKEWIKYLRETSEHRIDTMLVFDEEKLDERIKELSCMDPERMAEPENARLSEYQSDTKSYSVVPAVQGTELIEANVKRAVADAIMSLSTEVDLDAEECYTKAAVDETDEALNALAAELNQYVGAVVTYNFGDSTEVLDGDVIHQWLTVDGQTVTLDEEQAAAYVKELAGKYDTAYKSKTLKTSYGETVTISKGNYGWRINQKAETAAVLEIVKAGEQQTREPEYTQKAASRGENDYGSTYVEINLTAQHLYFYKDGTLLVESDFVSGNEARGWSTPAGAYPLTYKQRNATLKGEGYATPVSYWMPFNGGIGLHDASWRGSFGGSIYKTNGSHGCINLPPSVAKTIYENISAGDPVLCYHLSGTESKTTSKTTTSKPAATTAAATTAPAETAAPAESSAPAETPVSPVETQPVGPGAEAPGNTAGPGAETSGNTAGPGAENPAAESSPQETPASLEETQPAGPGAPETTPQITAGGDKESFGPGFADSVPEQTEAPVGPGY